MTAGKSEGQQGGLDPQRITDTVNRTWFPRCKRDQQPTTVLLNVCNPKQ